MQMIEIKWIKKRNPLLSENLYIDKRHYKGDVNSFYSLSKLDKINLTCDSCHASFGMYSNTVIPTRFTEKNGHHPLTEHDQG